MDAEAEGVVEWELRDRAREAAQRACGSGYGHAH